jgi:ATP-binding cassette, subfamily C (CFTR/MRP), member 1
MLTRMVFQVLITIVTISVSSPYFLIALVPIFIVYVLCQRYYVSAMRQLRRLNSTTRSPIFSHFGETLNGVSTVRAYNVQDKFIEVMNNKIDENLSYYYPDNVSNR